MNRNSDTALGIASAALGGGGLTYQAVMDGMSFALLAGNLVLCLGGLVLVGYRIHAAWRGTKGEGR